MYQIQRLFEDDEEPELRLQVVAAEVPRFVPDTAHRLPLGQQRWNDAAKIINQRKRRAQLRRGGSRAALRVPDEYDETDTQTLWDVAGQV